MRSDRQQKIPPRRPGGQSRLGNDGQPPARRRVGRRGWRRACCGVVVALAATSPAAAEVPGPEDDPIRAAEQDARNHSAVLELAEHMEDRRQWEAAASLYDQLLVSWGPSGELAFRKARALAFAGRYAAAATTLEALLVEYPEDLDATALLSRTLAWQERYADADAVLSEAEARLPDAPEVWLARAVLLYWQGRLEEAIEPLDRYLFVKTHDPEALALKAKILLGLDRLSEAKRYEVALAASGTAGAADALWRIDHYTPDATDKDFRMDVGYTHSLNALRQDWSNVFASFGWRATPTVTIGAGVEVEWRPEIAEAPDAFLSLNGNFRSKEWLDLDIALGFSPEPTFKPMVSFLLRQTFLLAEVADFYVYNKLWSFRDAVAPGDNLWINQLGPGVVLHFGPVDLDVGYRASLFDDSEPGHIFVLRADVRPIEQLWFMGGASYGKGGEVYFDRDAVVQDSLTAFAGAGFAPHPLYGFEAIWSYYTSDPDRDNRPVIGLLQHTITLHAFTRF